MNQVHIKETDLYSQTLRSFKSGSKPSKMLQQNPTNHFNSRVKLTVKSSEICIGVFFSRCKTGTAILI